MRASKHRKAWVEVARMVKWSMGLEASTPRKGQHGGGQHLGGTLSATCDGTLTFGPTWQFEVDLDQARLDPGAACLTQATFPAMSLGSVTFLLVLLLP